MMTAHRSVAYRVVKTWSSFGVLVHSLTNRPSLIQLFCDVPCFLAADLLCFFHLFLSPIFFLVVRIFINCTLMMICHQIERFCLILRLRLRLRHLLKLHTITPQSSIRVRLRIGFQNKTKHDQFDDLQYYANFSHCQIQIRAHIDH